jgi:hypothetical protein
MRMPCSSLALLNVVLDHVPTVSCVIGNVPGPSEQIDTQLSPLSEQQRVAPRPVTSSVHGNDGRLLVAAAMAAAAVVMARRAAARRAAARRTVAGRSGADGGGDCGSGWHCSPMTAMTSSSSPSSLSSL